MKHKYNVFILCLRFLQYNPVEIIVIDSYGNFIIDRYFVFQGDKILILYPQIFYTSLMG